ncbi:hypothetical protein V8C43DRAFT_273991 [Trichoderma afarasin]
MARQRRRCRTERSRPRDLDVFFALVKKGNWSADQPRLDDAVGSRTSLSTLP